MLNVQNNLTIQFMIYLSKYDFCYFIVEWHINSTFTFSESIIKNTVLN